MIVRIKRALPGLLVLAGCSGDNGSGGPPLQTVADVDLERYSGRWHELASIPAWFQEDCTGDVVADYRRLEGGLIEVINACATLDGRDVAEGRARPDPAYDDPARLEVTFVDFGTWIWWFGGDYWIIDLAEDYGHAVIGDPARAYGWVLARGDSLPPETWARIERVLREQGYDPCRFLLTRTGEQTFDQRPRLCDDV